MVQSTETALSFSESGILCRESGLLKITLRDFAHHVHYRHDLFPPGHSVDLTATAQFIPPMPYFMANGVQASHVEVDVEMGSVRLLNHWVIEDCGTVINPMLVDEQIRGGVIHGIGAALYEACHYDDEAQLLTGTLADHILPMASEMPDIYVGHVTTPTRGSELGAKGAGEAGAVGAPAAVLCAINDAIAPLGAEIDEQPATPAVICRAISRARSRALLRS
jgi:CO/xanthine dehydrogenase Mo-binding subunit